MEALGAAASIINVVQLAGEVFGVCLEYSLQVKDAKRDIERLQDQCSDLQKLLAKVADLASAPNADKLPALAEVLQPGGPLQKCQLELESLLSKLEGGSKSEMKRVGLRALKWPFSSAEVDKTVAALERCKAAFTLALATDQIKLTLVTSQDLEEHRKGEYKEKIIQWLSTVEPGISWTNHDDAWNKHEPDTGLWLVRESDDFEYSKSTRNRVLWVQGMPGCGKTIMISYIIEELKRFCEGNPKRALTYFYFDFGTPAKQIAVSCARYLLSHLIGRHLDIPDAIKDLYVKKCYYGNDSLNLQDLTAMLELYAGLDGTEDLYIVLDGLDESPLKDYKRAELLDWIDTLTKRLKFKLHLCMSSRPKQDIREKFSSFRHLTEIPMKESNVGRDIKTYIQRELSMRPKFKRLPQELKREVQDTLVRGAQGMYESGYFLRPSRHI
jgi:hypothetical protein